MRLAAVLVRNASKIPKIAGARSICRRCNDLFPAGYSVGTIGQCALPGETMTRNQWIRERDAPAVEIQQGEQWSFFSELRRLSEAAYRKDRETAASAPRSTAALKRRANATFLTHRNMLWVS
jgi:hypothetical protein